VNTNVTTKAQWIALADRCETATGPDRDIDAEIYDATTPHVLYAGEYAGKFAVRTSGSAVWLPFFTYSIDDITALIERELAPISVDLQIRPKDAYAKLWLHSRNDPSIRQAATPALALCAAFCRAMAEKVA
jgi:hypothetical protein